MSTDFGYDNKTSEENIEKETQILLDRAKEVKEHPENLIPFDILLAIELYSSLLKIFSAILSLKILYLLFL